MASKPLLSGVAGSTMGAPAGYRSVRANEHAVGPDGEPAFCDNLVITSHYTVANFVPKFLMEQFSRFANAYFLTVSILQMIPAVSITNGVPTSMVPLASVLLFDAIVTAREDQRRHHDDDFDNGRPTLAVRNGKFQRVPWRDVRVGDVLKVRRGDVFPADLVFLHAHTTDGVAPEACYVQTAQLDGETNLKLKKAVQETAEHFVDDETCARFSGVLQAEPPNGMFGKFTATLKLGDDAAPAPLEADQILLRGCVLRNVEYVYGMVVYTGRETKVRVKQKEVSAKRASIEGFINRNILALVAILVGCCILGVIMYSEFYAELDPGAWYLSFSSTSGTVSFGDAIGKVFTFFLLNSNFVPVSLYVSMKIARTGQKYFMERDLALYHEEKELVASSGGAEGEYPLKVRTMDLNDELGQISHIFSDKTGTFTLNYMDFRKLSINGVSYGLGTTEIGLDRMKREGQDTRELEAIMSAQDSKPRAQPHVNFDDGSDSHPGHSIAADRTSTEPVYEGGYTQAQAIDDFFLHLGLNHTVVVEKLMDDQGRHTGSQLSASSPDEEAFVYAGRFFGYSFEDRAADEVMLTVNGKPRKFVVLHVLAYNQMRKRMSVIVQEVLGEDGTEEGPIRLYCKGADSVILARLRAPTGSADVTVHEQCASHLRTWGNDGLRTLCFGFRELDADFYDEWNEQYIAARGSIEELSKRKNHEPNAIDDLMNKVESELILQGATANEDKLQPRVPETIANLAQAGINIWMLTGDKQETAVNIGYATRMLDDHMTHHVCTTESEGSDTAAVEKLAGIDTRGVARQGKEWALIIDEKALDLACATPTMRKKLLEVSRACKAVICCRARPDQKAEMVRLIREGVPGTKTLAIGDGANDVDMIQTAHVGVGIVGAEGVQAANASDFSIGRFRFLERLLLVHGRWNYRRMSKLVCYMFYKNICMVLTQFFFTSTTAWSGQKFFIELAVQSFNLIYTGPAILLIALADQDVAPANALAYPQLYKPGQKGAKLNNSVFWGNWVTSAVLDAAIIFSFTRLAYAWGDMHADSPYVFELGSACFTGVVVVTNARAALETHAHYPFFQLVVFMSVASWWPLAFFFDLLNSNGMRGGMQQVFGSAATWFVSLLILVVTVGRLVYWKAYRRYFAPELAHAVQEAELVSGVGYALLDGALRPMSEKRTEAEVAAAQLRRADTLRANFSVDEANADMIGEIATRPATALRRAGARITASRMLAGQGRRVSQRHLHVPAELRSAAGGGGEYK